MSVFAKLLRGAFLARCGRIERAARSAVEIQYRTLDELLRRGRRTDFGRTYGLDAVRGPEDFARTVAVFDYESFSPHIERMRRGESDVACKGRVTMFARSSGTTSSRSKYIPVTREALRRNHLRGMADTVSLYLAANPASRLFEGRTLTLGGSCCRDGYGALVGDLSALTLHAAGRMSGAVRAPSLRTALMEDFDAKCEAICRECAAERITALAGVPSWNLALLRRVTEFAGRRMALEVWPDLELFMHGGVSFKPYREAFAEAVGGAINYMECYNASEGFVAVAERAGCEDMLLMPDYGCYYEFESDGRTVPLEGVRAGGEYAVLLTSVNGLWRYRLGDKVTFTSTDPWRLRVAGRTKQYVNAFGEELMIGNAEEALARACRVSHAVVNEYTVAPKYMSASGDGCHEWVAEFVREPDDRRRFAEELDRALRELNSDYDAKRRSVMGPPEVRIVPRGTFLRWQTDGRRNKVPRLVNDRSVADAVTEYAARDAEVRV